MTSVTLDAGPDDNAQRHDRNCECRTCRRRAALRGDGIIPRIDGVTARSFPNPPYREPDLLPPRHPETGQFLAERHPVHDGRDRRGRYIDEGAYDG